MAKETIHAIREAEAEAAKTEADAVKEAARIVKRAGGPGSAGPRRPDTG